jgi:hypothetical protein
MNPARFDLTSDHMIFFGVLFLIFLAVAVALERYSPSRQSRRKVRRHTREHTSDLID